MPEGSMSFRILFIIYNYNIGVQSVLFQCRVFYTFQCCVILLVMYMCA